jgi:hypothetical protein
MLQPKALLGNSIVFLLRKNLLRSRGLAEDGPCQDPSEMFLKMLWVFG